VQNADDNTYEPGVNPCIQFCLRQGHLLVSNNESGFEPKHVEALCALAQSTKKQKEGYIGEKGIGFKSVFVWTDEPHVRSNGFDFALKHGQISGKELGFLVPYYPARARWPEEADLPDMTAMTMFYMPFRTTGHHCQPGAAIELSKQFQNDMRPETGEAIAILRALCVRACTPRPILCSAPYSSAHSALSAQVERNPTDISRDGKAKRASYGRLQPIHRSQSD
jgi:hypothetical protein